MMSGIGLTLAKIGLSKPNVKLVIMSNHGKTGLIAILGVVFFLAYLANKLNKKGRRVK